MSSRQLRSLPYKSGKGKGRGKKSSRQQNQEEMEQQQPGQLQQPACNCTGITSAKPSTPTWICSTYDG